MPEHSSKIEKENIKVCLCNYPCTCSDYWLSIRASYHICKYRDRTLQLSWFDEAKTKIQ